MLKLPAYITGYNRRPDRSCTIRLETQELSPEALLELDRHYQAFGWFLFQENPFSDKDIPKEQAEDKNKTPSKRLKSTLFVLSQQEGVKKEDFEAYYRAKMEKLIDYIKAKIDQ